MTNPRKPIKFSAARSSARQRREFAALPHADYEVITDYTATCPSCQKVLPTTQHNNQFAYNETVTCACGKTARVIWSN